MNKIRLSLALFMGFTMAATVCALEVTVGKTKDASAAGSAVDMKMNSLQTETNAVLNEQQSEINAIKDCAAELKLWDGEQCIAPEAQVRDPDIIDTSEDVTYAADTYPTNRHGCSSSKMNWWTDFKCSKKTGVTYEFFPDMGKKGTVKIHYVHCNPRTKHLGCL